MTDSIFDAGVRRSILHWAAALGAVAAVVGCVPIQPGTGFPGGPGNGPVRPVAQFECPETIWGVPDVEQVFTCHCGPVQPSSMPLAVVGTNIYDATSQLCLAGVHAGAIGWEGGNISVNPAGHRREFYGSERNGVRSDSLNFNHYSFYFVGY
ncbi:MAG: LCCL domain-containing protein [Alphaproteobacteria bacterium]